METKEEISKVNFMLSPDWIIQQPIDFEHKKYILLSFLKKCEEKFNQGEIYPYFIELSLHFANAHVFEKENKILYTDKIFKSADDELLINELKSVKIPDFSPNENLELIKINKYFGLRIHEYFSVAKSIWTLAFESCNLQFKRNKSNGESDKGFVIYKDTFNKKTYIWEYSIENEIKAIDNRCTFKLILNSDVDIKSPLRTIKKYTSFDNEIIDSLPIVEMFSTQNFPVENTLAPIFKRRLMNFIFQSKKKIEAASNF
jgi:hypothetical protein